MVFEFGFDFPLVTVGFVLFLKSLDLGFELLDGFPHFLALSITVLTEVLKILGDDFHLELKVSALSGLGVFNIPEYFLLELFVGPIDVLGRDLVAEHLLALRDPPERLLFEFLGKVFETADLLVGVDF